MSENIVVTAPLDDSAASGDSQMTAGSLLRQAREASGLHIAALAVSLKVPVKKLEWLEADRLDMLPDAVFVRALASSVCRALKIDSSLVLEKLPLGGSAKLQVDERGINAPFRTPGEPSGWAIPAILSKPSFVVVALLILAALVVAFFPDTGGSKVSQIPVDKSAAEKEGAPAAIPGSLTKQSAAEPQVPSVPAAAETVPAASAPKPVVKAEPGEVAPDGGQNAALVSIKTKGVSWVQITDGKGVVLLNKTLVAGDAVAVPGRPPVSVVIGRSDVTDVEVRGRPFNLADVSKENVARFEVN